MVGSRLPCPFGCGDRLFRSKARRRHVHKRHGPVPDFCTTGKEPFLSTRALNSHNKHKHSNTELPTQRVESLTIYERNQVPSSFAPTSISPMPQSNSPNRSTASATNGTCIQELLAHRVETIYERIPFQPNCATTTMCPMPQSNSSHSSTASATNVMAFSGASRSFGLTTSGPSTGLFSVPDLDDFISSEIQPDSSFLAGTSQSVDHLVTLLQHNVPDRLRPSRVIKGGSLGKGTAVKDKSDIDMTLMMSKYSNVRDLVHDMPHILSELEESLQHIPGISVDGNTRHSVQISLAGLSVDILPAVDVTREFTLDEVYRKMIGSDASVKDFYSPSLAPLQTELVRDLPTKVKSLIRLIKYWNKNNVKPMLLSGCPTSYIYIIIMDRWVKAGRPDSFDMTRAVHDVLTSLNNNRDFQILTPGLAHYEISVADIRHETYIMDPCNPTNDLYNSRNWNWDGVAAEARLWLNQPVFQGISGTAGSWTS